MIALESTNMLTHQPSKLPFKPKGRTLRAKRVYGKRKVNAAKAVLEGERTSSKRESLEGAVLEATTSAVDELVERLQEKLAEITIQEKTPKKREVKRKSRVAVEIKRVIPSAIEEVKETSCTNTVEERNPKKSDVITKPRIAVEINRVVSPAKKVVEEASCPNTVEEKGPNVSGVKTVSRIAVEVKRVVSPAKEEVKEISCTNTVEPSIPQVHTAEDNQSHNAGNTLELLNAKPEKKERRKRTPKVQPQCQSNNPMDTYVTPILKEAMSIKRLEDFDTWANRAGDTFDVEKIAEGSYGEVYQLRVRQDVTISKQDKAAKLKAYDNGVFKIVPLRAQRGPGSKKFTPIQEVVAEVQMLKLLDPIPGFARFRDVHVVHGRLPKAYQAAWTHYSQTRDDCYNPDPSKKKSYPDNQLWAVLEMDNAGHELERFDCSSIFQIYDIFWGVALALARAEQFAGFEHRDLHLGNICIKSTRADGCLQRPREEKTSRKTDIASTGFGFSGIETTIIDYSLSRASLSKDDFPTGDGTAWSDLDKKQLFDAIGNDDDEKLLRDTYRLMRMEVYRDQSSNQPRDEPWRWKEFCPRTNLIWLSFLLTMLLSKGQTRNILPKPRHPLTARSINRVLGSDLDNGKAGGKVKPAEPNSLPGLDFQLDLLDRLQTVLDILNPDVQAGEEEILFCTGDLVAFAIGSRWLDESDFLC